MATHIAPECLRKPERADLETSRAVRALAPARTCYRQRDPTVRPSTEYRRMESSVDQTSFRRWDQTRGRIPDSEAQSGSRGRICTKGNASSNLHESRQQSLEGKHHQQKRDWPVDEREQTDGRFIT